MVRVGAVVAVHWTATLGQKRTEHKEEHCHHMRLLRRLLVLMVWVLASWPIYYFLGALWAPDACLDHGGSFDYRLWQCSQETQPYINIALHEIPGFWFAAGSLVLAIAGTRLIKQLMASQDRLPKSESGNMD